MQKTFRGRFGRQQPVRDNIEVLVQHHLLTTESWREPDSFCGEEIIGALVELESQGLLTINTTNGIVALTAAGIAAANAL